MHAIVNENQIVVATTMNTKVEGTKKKSIKVMQIALPEISGRGNHVDTDYLTDMGTNFSTALLTPWFDQILFSIFP